jgi:hypothetical protein
LLRTHAASSLHEEKKVNKKIFSGNKKLQFLFVKKNATFC